MVFVATLFSLCNKVIANKIVVAISQSLLENKEISKKKKKKKPKKKNKTPENFPLFCKKPCVFFANPQEDKGNFCETWTLSQMIAKDLVSNTVKNFKSDSEEEKKENPLIKSISLNTNEHNKSKDTICSPPNKEKDHRIGEHIEHRKISLLFLAFCNKNF